MHHFQRSLLSLSNFSVRWQCPHVVLLLLLCYKQCSADRRRRARAHESSETVA